MKATTTKLLPAVTTLDQLRKNRSQKDYQVYVQELSSSELRREIDHILHHLSDDSLWKIDVIMLHLENKSSKQMALTIKKLRRTVYRIMSETVLKLNDYEDLLNNAKKLS